MKTAREMAHEYVSMGATWGAEWCHANRAKLAIPDHSRACDRLTAAISARDAATEARERTLDGALAAPCFADDARTLCRNCRMPVTECERYPGDCRWVIAGRRALAAVEALKQGGL